ncbi:hypothetical protein CbuK_1717 [Coxiella burnetii CbuK_Q154]|uniref:Uncharacterized protein n=1 Tax=Coxiella burnetii (strain Dugway 5J108-111) TaxID=434922 RepID=B5XH89_COXBN|nr:hypothetical protein CBUD_0528a [Coxiella burnetii Dugway 5J108-111]ACJ17939.1 hypothetical protein CbuG_0520 [Coxiella burnetii CbuG_Q212]ACJ20851.1 hypothetical protein CbuK_1717 [Coxiella burnetii CbuK_Q154]AIT63935.1 hypothetical protein CBNA_1721 [Coxiella burnetii str. Namibia]
MTGFKFLSFTTGGSDMGMMSFPLQNRWGLKGKEI